MGKRKTAGGLSGMHISAFMLQALRQETIEPSPSCEQDNSSSREKESAPHKLTSTEWNKDYDATGLVPHYTNAEDVPDHLQKYFYQRERLFSLYAAPPGCLLDEEGWYSVTPELIANQIAKRCRCDTILDAFCGIGGNAIAFAQTCQRVIAIDTSPVRLALARHNAQVYGVADRIEFILADYFSFAAAYLSHNPSPSSARKIDVVFLSPPWGGPSYLEGSQETAAGPSHPLYSLSSIQPIHGAKLFHLTHKITPNIAYYLPRNTDVHEISALLTTEDKDQRGSEKSLFVEIEEEWMGRKLKALTCYFGGLVDGQENLF